MRKTFDINEIPNSDCIQHPYLKTIKKKKHLEINEIPNSCYTSFDCCIVNPSLTPMKNEKTVETNEIHNSYHNSLCLNMKTIFKNVFNIRKN